MVASPPRADTAQTAESFGNYIAGEWIRHRAARRWRTVTRPIGTRSSVASRRPAAEDVDAAVSAAAEAYRTWRFSSPMARANILHKAANILESRIPEVGRELTREEGKTLKEGIGETTRAVQILRYYAGEAQQPSGEHYPSINPHTLLYTSREPLGVVAVVTPWNFPIAIPAWKIAPALAFGNTVVFKPASLTPLTAVRLVEALAEAGLPPGVLNLVTGSARECRGSIGP